MQWNDKDGWCREYTRSYFGACYGNLGPHRVWAPSLRAAMEDTLDKGVFVKGQDGDIFTRIDCIASGEYIVFRYNRKDKVWDTTKDTFKGGAT